MIRIEMEDGGVIELELYPDIAPLTAANFEKLAKEGFYDGLIFHRVISGFMIQGGTRRARAWTAPRRRSRENLKQTAVPTLFPTSGG